MNPTKLDTETFLAAIPLVRALWSEHDLARLPEAQRGDPAASLPKEAVTELVALSADVASLAGLCPDHLWADTPEGRLGVRSLIAAKRPEAEPPPAEPPVA